MDINNPHPHREEEPRDNRSFADKNIDRYRTARKARKMYAWLRRARMAAWAARIGSLFLGGWSTLLIAFVVVFVILIIGAIYLLIFKDDSAFDNFTQEPTTPGATQPSPSGTQPISGFEIVTTADEEVGADEVITYNISISYSEDLNVVVYNPIPQNVTYYNTDPPATEFDELDSTVYWRLDCFEPDSVSGSVRNYNFELSVAPVSDNIRVFNQPSAVVPTESFRSSLLNLNCGSTQSRRDTSPQTTLAQETTQQSTSVLGQEDSGVNSTSLAQNTTSCPQSHPYLCDDIGPSGEEVCSAEVDCSSQNITVGSTSGPDCRQNPGYCESLSPSCPSGGGGEVTCNPNTGWCETVSCSQGLDPSSPRYQSNSNMVETRVGDPVGTDLPPNTNTDDFNTLMEGQGRNVGILGNEDNFVETVFQNAGSRIGPRFTYEPYLRDIHRIATAHGINPLIILTIWGVEQSFGIIDGLEFGCDLNNPASRGFANQVECSVNTLNYWMNTFEEIEARDGLPVPYTTHNTCYFTDPFIYAYEAYTPVCSMDHGNDIARTNFVIIYKEFLGVD